MSVGIDWSGRCPIMHPTEPARCRRRLLHNGHHKDDAGRRWDVETRMVPVHEIRSFVDPHRTAQTDPDPCPMAPYQPAAGDPAERGTIRGRRARSTAAMRRLRRRAAAHRARRPAPEA